MLASGVRTGPFRSEDRLLDSRDFRRVMRQGFRRSNSDLVVFIDSSHQQKSKKLNKNSLLGQGMGLRLGITVSRKVGNSVCRNRFKRRVRAWFRERRGDLARELGLENADLIVIARKPGGRLGWAELDARLSALLRMSSMSGTPVVPNATP